MKSFICLFFLILFCTISCRRADNVDVSVMVVRMDPKECRFYHLDSLFSKYRLVPLETREDCLVGKLRGIQMLDDRILVLSNTSGDQELLFFDGSGRFISKTTKGKGPGEVGSIQSFYADTEDQSVWIANNANLQYYDRHGKYPGCESSPVSNIVSLAPEVLSGLFQEFKIKATSLGQLTAYKRYPAIFEMLDTLDINANPVLLIGKLR